MVLAVFIVCVIVSAALLAGGFALRNQMSDRQTLMATIATPVFLLASVLSGIYWWDGPAIIEDGAGPMYEQLPLFEREYANWKADKGKGDAYSVWVLGDSTHQSRGNDKLKMVPAIRQAVYDRNITRLNIHGFFHPNCNAMEFYFLLNRLVENPPDLVVMPLNLRAFGSRWIDDSRNGFPVMERYIPWRQIPEAVKLSTQGRKITMPGVAFYKLDWLLFGSRVQWFFNGLRLRAETKRMDDTDSLLLEPGNAKSYRTRTEALRWLKDYRAFDESIYDEFLGEDHPLIPTLKAIDRLASQHGVSIMYYTVQTPDLRANQHISFAALQKVLSGERGVRFIEMLDVIPPDDFERMEHFYASGMRRVAGRLVDEIEAVRTEAAAPESIPVRAQ